MKSLLPVLGAGSVFAGTSLAGLAAGIWLDHRLGTEYWALALLFAGLLLGMYSAWRLLARTLSS